MGQKLRMSGPGSLRQFPKHSGRRGHSRLRLRQPAELITLGGQVRCGLINLSQTGARIEIAPVPRPGASAFLRFCGQEVFGTVVWSSASACGMRFDEPLTAKVMLAARDFADANPELVRQQFESSIRDWVSGKGRMV
jgi:PilZ domain